LPGCRFAPRCPLAAPECENPDPPLETIAPEHSARCVRLDAAGRLLEEVSA